MQPLILVKRILSYIAKFIPNNISLPILLGPLKGFRWISGAAAGEAKGLSILFNLVESEQLKIAQKKIKHHHICFDIGANLGLYSLLFSRYSKLVYSFEPLPRNICYLYQNLIKNKVKNTIIVPMGVANSNKLYGFIKGNNFATGKINENGSQPISLVSLDNFIEYYKTYPDIIKIDVEGAELEVLKGLEKTFLKIKPIIFLSTHYDDLKKKCFKMLKNKGYNHFFPLDSNIISKANEFLIES